MPDAIAVLNAGSSSIKFSLFADRGDGARARAARPGRGPVHVAALRREGSRTADCSARRRGAKASRSATTARSIIWSRSCAAELAGHRLVGVGHRVVHGGLEYTQPVRVDATVLTALEKYVPLAPLHQPHNLAPIRALLEARAGAAAGRVLRHRVPPRAAGGRAGVRAAARRSPTAACAATASTACRTSTSRSVLPQFDARAARGRTVVLHLGNGSSMCAIDDGRSVASTMGFTAADGLPMGTRCGNLDPGVMLYLMDELRMDARAIEKLIYQQSGLLGVSGISSDMRTLRGERRARRRRRRSTSSSTGSAASWARSPRRWAASTRSCSPRGIGENSRTPARARLPRRGVAGRRARRGGQRRATARASAPRGAASPPGSFRPTRN